MENNISEVVHTYIHQGNNIGITCMVWLFVIVCKFVNLLCRCGVAVVVLYTYAVLNAHRNCCSKGIG